MRRVWTTVASVWIVLAIVAALAWTRQPPARAVGAPFATTLLIKGKHGTTQRVLVLGTASPTAAHATTQTSPAPLP